ncbi:MAG: pantoate kinase [Candidatus Methanomethylophilaceae archaeon]
MKVSAFCPGHVSCIFEPSSTLHPLSTGSRGLGIRLSLGSTATVEERDDDMVNIYIDGSSSSAHITRMTVNIIAPGRGFDIWIDNDLPMSQGFGTSASGALASGIAASSLVGVSRTKAFEAAHVAEVRGGGGMGDVAAIVAGLDIPVRTRAGFPPRGLVENADMKFPVLTVAVLGPKMVTEGILGDSLVVNRIRDSGRSALDEFLEDPTREMFFRMSNRFSSEIGLESPAVRKAIMRLNADGYNAGMCMLGNSIFTDAPIDRVRSLLGRGNVRAFSCSSSGREIKVTRKA